MNCCAMLPMARSKMFKIINKIFIILLVIRNGVETKCPHLIDTCNRGQISFYLYTELRQPYDEILINDENSIKNAPFIPNAEIKLIIHGYGGSKDKQKALIQIRNEYLILKKFNILVVDWGPLAKKGCYPTARYPSVALVGKCCAQFVNSLIQYRPEINDDKIHLIGFSLGAQAGARFAVDFRPRIIKRISGLDPAYPFFTIPLTPPHEILNREHAKFVDVIHSNMGIYGVFFSNAIYDIYLNKGTFQPGCNIFDIPCSHRRSAEVFAESINSKTKFIARKCAHNWFFVTFRSCDGHSKRRIEVGEYCVPPDKEEDTGTYHLNTNDHPPYARGPDGA